MDCVGHGLGVYGLGHHTISSSGARFLSLGEQLVLLSETPMHLKKAKQVGAGLTQLGGAMSMAW